MERSGENADEAFPGGDGVTVRLTEAAALGNLRAVLQQCAAGRLRCSEKTSRPSAATVGVVAAALVDGDFSDREAIAGYAWPLLLQAGGLAELAGGRLQLTGRGLAALTGPAEETLRRLWSRWLSHGVIDEMSRVEAIKGQRSARALTAVKPRRQAVGQALAACPPGEWLEVDEVFARVRRLAGDMTVARDVWKLYIAEPQYGSLGYAGFHDWPVLEGRYVLCVLFEYAATLGLFDVAFTDPAGAREDFRRNWGAEDLMQLSRYDGLRAVRLTALGAYAMDLTPGYEPVAEPASVGPTLEVLATLEVVATGAMRPGDELLLDAYAERTSDRVWSLSAGSLLAAVDRGRALEELRQFLQQQAGHALPSSVTTLIGDITGRTASVRSRGVVHLIECTDPPLAALIAGDRHLRRLCTTVGDRHLAVPLEHEPAFREALRALGYAATMRP
jgi:hypothetical protein